MLQRSEPQEGSRPEGTQTFETVQTCSVLDLSQSRDEEFFRCSFVYLERPWIEQKNEGAKDKHLLAPRSFECMMMT